MTDPAARARFEFLVEIYLGAVLGWVDVTADVRGQVSITRGQSSESNRANPGTCAFRVDNTSGDFSWRNPAGQWYGLIGPNTPLRLSAGLAGGTLYSRFYGEVPQWPTRWSVDEVDRYVDVTAAGILRRLSQGEQPALSPLHRAIIAEDPVAYWPLEDGSAAGVAGSALQGQPSAAISGDVTFTALEDVVLSDRQQRYGTAALVDLAAGGSLQGTVPAAGTTATASAWTVEAVADVNVSAASGDVVMFEVETPGGSFVRWRLVFVKATSRTQVIAYDSAGSATTVVDLGSAPGGGFSTRNLSVWQSGGTINVGYGWFHYTLPSGTGAWTATGSVAGTLAGVTRVTVNATGATQSSPMQVGHLTVWAEEPTPIATYGLDGYGYGRVGAILSYRDEAATERMKRVCAEQDIDLDVVDPSVGLVSRMGWQPTATFGDLLDECAEADGGYLFEQRDALGLAYRTRESLYNQTPVPIAYAGQLVDPFEPVDDADAVRNDVTVKRSNGSSARAVQTTGRLAAVPPPDGVGVYRTEVELNLSDDAALVDQASWRVHLGTVDRPRYPALSVQLAAPGWEADPSGVAALLAVDTGDVLEVTGLPSWAAGDARTLVTGYSETFDEWLWSITFAGVPAQPWDVAEFDGPARFGAAGSTLFSDLPATSTVHFEFTFTTANGPWTTDPAAFPLDVRVGDEQIRVSAITGTTSPQSATIAARGVNGVLRDWPAGAEVDVWQPAVLAL